MSTTTANSPVAHATPPRDEHSIGALQRVLNVAKLHLVNRGAVLWLPLFIMSVIWTSSMLIWWIVSVMIERAGGADGDGPTIMGGANSFLVIYMLVVAVQAINLTFPFAQGYSVTRRDFYLGSGLAFLGLSIFYAILMSGLAWLEVQTGGWGLNGYMFSLGILGVAGLAQTFYVYLLALLLFFCVGMAVASMYVRWRAWGIMGFFTGLGFIIIGLLALATFTDSWGAVGQWLVTNGAVGVATWSLLVTAFAGVAGFLILRRATPRA